MEFKMSVTIFLIFLLTLLITLDCMKLINLVFSDLLLFLPYSMIKVVEGENDGLVALESAKWGEFKGIITNKFGRGISHGDMIDLKREDYKDFDVLEFYVNLVHELKEKGF